RSGPVQHIRQFDRAYRFAGRNDVCSDGQSLHGSAVDGGQYDYSAGELLPGADVQRNFGDGHVRVHVCLGLRRKYCRERDCRGEFACFHHRAGIAGDDQCVDAAGGGLLDMNLRHTQHVARMTLLAWLLACGAAWGTTYYVDPAGSNGNNGLSPQTPWRTLLKVGISSFQPGDVILFKRDGVWNEWLTPPSSGAAGNPIKFDAYGNGRPPEFTGYYATTAAQWSNTGGNVWQITLSATQPVSQLKFVRFGSLWGNAQGTQSALAHD